MMLYDIEALLKGSSDVVGDCSKAFVEKVYARPAYKIVGQLRFYFVIVR
jgi:hypothetical protein